MADFVAVIRRAVDGLSDNTPEMRTKVYEKARGAVLRQLESMKPRPPEDLLRRQLDKLENAILEVETEHASAAPAADDDDHDAPEALAEEHEVAEREEAEQPEVYAEPAAVPHDDDDRYDDVPAEQPAAHAEPAEPAEPEWQAHEAAAEEPAAVYAEPEPVAAHEPEAAQEWLPEQEPERPAEVEEYHEPVHAVVHEETYSEVQPAVAEHWSPAEVVSEPAPAAPDAAYADGWPEVVHHQPDTTDFHDVTEPAVETPVAARSHPVPEWVDIQAPEAASTVQPDAWISPAPTPLKPIVHNKTASSFDDVLSDAEQSDGHTPVSIPVPDPTAKMPATLDLLDWDESASPFDDVALPEKGEASVASVNGQEKSRVNGAAVKGNRGPLDELESVIGYQHTNGVDDMEDLSPPDLSSVLSQRQARSFRVQPKRRAPYGAIIGGLVAVLVLGGAGYAGWLYKDKLTALVAGLSNPAPDLGAGTKAATSTPPATDAKPAADAGTATAQTPTTPVQTPANATAAASDGTSAASKFTERLLADGSEVNAGQGGQPGDAATSEGKSVSEQNIASNQTPIAESAQAPAASGTTAGAAAPVTPAATTPPPAALGAGQKMYLYEERVGQSSPTAIEGRVVWSVQQEAGEDGKSEPTVQGQVTVPDRGLSALLTFKRNTDPSLPASHLVEIVFSLPKDFEGGAIDSVQRIALKQTEQDRGDPLIAVPAKITDDFHMIALNDFPDAMKTNLELLRTRSWMDIPIAYRNGRRALLTLEKGQSGTDAFNTAIKAWAAMGAAPTSQ